MRSGDTPDPARWRRLLLHQGRAEGAMSSPQDPAERLVLADSFASPGDPVEGNPFPIDDPRHQVWIGATRTAEEEVCHINSRALLNLTPGPAQDWPTTIVIAKFDAWARRGASLVWS